MCVFVCLFVCECVSCVSLCVGGHGSRFLYTGTCNVFSSHKTVFGVASADSQTASQSLGRDSVGTETASIVIKREGTVHIISELLTLADKYQMPDLFHQCQLHLANAVVGEHAVALLVLADAVRARVLKEAVFEFLRASGDNLRAFMQNDDFMKLPKHLLHDVLEMFASAGTSKKRPRRKLVMRCAVITSVFQQPALRTR